MTNTSKYGWGLIRDRFTGSIGQSIQETQLDIFHEQLLKDYLYEVNQQSVSLTTSMSIQDLRTELDAVFVGELASLKFTKDNAVCYINPHNRFSVQVVGPKDESSGGPWDDYTEGSPEDDDGDSLRLSLAVVYTDQATMALVVNSLLSHNFSKKAPPEKLEVNFAFPGVRGIRTETRYTDHLSLESIRDNYVSDTFAQCSLIVDRIKESNHGLVLLSGIVGSGKTYMIRAMLSELSALTPVVCIPAHRFLSEAGLLADVITRYRKSVIVLEDLGDLLSIESPLDHAEARANLLNISEGLLSLVGDTILLFTFNHDMSKIDPAVTRPGRCLGSVIFSKLPYEQVQRRLDFTVPRQDYTLAELYEMIRLGGPMTTIESRPVGFKTGRS